MSEFSHSLALQRLMPGTEKRSRSAQQQALINQAIQGQQHWMWGMIAFQIAGLLIGGWVVYMFYARLRDIAEELMKLRVVMSSYTNSSGGVWRATATLLQNAFIHALLPKPDQHVTIEEVEIKAAEK